MYNDKQTNIDFSPNKPKSPKRIWKRENNPYRSIVLWGWNRENEPSFLILYGSHNFKESNVNGDSVNNILEDCVTYTSFAIFNGKQGHLPSFEAVRMVEDGGYYNRDKQDEYPKLYYKKANTYNSWSYGLNHNFSVEEYKKLPKDKYIKVPYFESVPYGNIVKLVAQKRSILNIFKRLSNQYQFDGFKFANSPNEILNLSGDLSKYYEIICCLLSDKNLYTRKKMLKLLLDSNPPKDLYYLLLNIGSTEVISGLFLELAKRRDTKLIEAAGSIINSDINWASENYVKGLKRCAVIYVNAVDEELKKKRTMWIRKTLPEMDLHLIRIKNKEFKPGKIIEGAAYRKYANQEVFSEFEYKYERDAAGKYHCNKYRKENIYNEGMYTDGLVFNISKFKNTLQEAEVYGLADVIGKIAYYLDSPRLVYYFKGSGNAKVLRYFRRYVRRIIDDYGKNDSKKFMEAMKSLLTSYKKEDYLCKYRGNFQFNYFIKHYLYYDFKEKPPIGWDNYDERHNWMCNDQLAKLEGRYDFMKDVWNKHIKDVFYIATNANIDVVIKGCYYIMLDSQNQNDIMGEISIKQLIELSSTSYKPLAEWFRSLLYEKLTTMKIFDVNIMMDLLSSDNEKVNEMAINYFNNTNGKFSPSDVIDLFAINNIEIIKKNIEDFNEHDYIEFIKVLVSNKEKLKSIDGEVIKVLEEPFDLSTNKVSSFTKEGKYNLVLYIVDKIISSVNIERWIEEFLEKVIFTLKYEELIEILKNIDIHHKNGVLLSVRNSNIISMLTAIKEHSLPTDAEILSILEYGTSKIIKVLLKMLDDNNENLIDRYSTLLLMFESDVVILNDKVENIFNNVAIEKKREILKVLLDSPVEKVYAFAIKKLEEIYESVIPEEFIRIMMEHTSPEMKSYVSNKIYNIIENFGDRDEELFLYYAKALLLLPNKVVKGKQNIYNALNKFVMANVERMKAVETLLMEIGSSNIIKDSELALTTLARLKMEVAIDEG